MPKEWTGNLVGLMHVHKITNKMLGDAIVMSVWCLMDIAIRRMQKSALPKR